MSLRIVLEEYLNDAGGQVIETHKVDTLIPLEKLVAIDDPDEWTEACKLVGKLVINTAREILNANAGS